jgi:hypothetical protein
VNLNPSLDAAKNSTVNSDAIKNVFIAFFDVLAFKQLSDTYGTRDLSNRYLNLINNEIVKLNLSGIAFKQPDGSYRCLHHKDSQLYKIISDSVIVKSANDSDTEFLYILRTANAIMKQSLKTPFRLRGAIGYGDFLSSSTDEWDGSKMRVNDIWLGSSIVDAYTTESEQKWSNCILTDKCMTFIKNNKYLDKPGIRRLLVDYSSIPLKDNKRIKGLVVDSSGSQGDKDIIDPIFQESTDERANEIIKNTAEYISWLRSTKTSQ